MVIRTLKKPKMDNPMGCLGIMVFPEQNRLSANGLQFAIACHVARLIKNPIAKDNNTQLIKRKNFFI